MEGPWSKVTFPLRDCRDNLCQLGTSATSRGRSQQHGSPDRIGRRRTKKSRGAPGNFPSLTARIKGLTGRTATWVVFKAMLPASQRLYWRLSASGLVKSENAHSTKSYRHELPKAVAVLVGCGDFLPGRGRDTGNNVHPERRSRCTSARAHRSADSRRHRDTGDESCCADNAEKARQDLSRHRLLVWIRI